eukprot:COSAG03_NODE_2119_length_3105_cov_3.504657_4_plen_96_part_00
MEVQEQEPEPESREPTDTDTHTHRSAELPAPDAPQAADVSSRLRAAEGEIEAWKSIAGDLRSELAVLRGEVAQVRVRSVALLSPPPSSDICAAAG